MSHETTLLVDSAKPDEVREAAALGFVTSVTTNPTLVAAAGRPAAELVRELAAIVSGTVFYQLTADTVEGRIAEADAMLRVAPGRVGLKIAATPDNLPLVARYRSVPVAVTAIFGASQALVAAAAGARYVIPYVNRTTRLVGDGLAWVRQLRAVCDATGGKTEVLAASVKSPEEAVATLLAGAHHLTLPLAVLRALGGHPLSDATVAEFARAGKG
ncbi:MAG: transaldolase family protein [Polyangiales bacterium]